GCCVVGDIAVVGDGRAASVADLRNHGFGGGQVDVIDQYLGAFGGEGQGIGPTQPAAGAGDDDGAVLADWHMGFSGESGFGAGGPLPEGRGETGGPCCFQLCSPD